MAINNLPPQAYTRETVAEAFEWMKGQSPSTRDLAKDANTLVSLYLNAKRHKRIKNMKPEDTAIFQSELKDLAKGIQQFNQDGEAITQQDSLTSDIDSHSLAHEMNESFGTGPIKTNVEQTVAVEPPLATAQFEIKTNPIEPKNFKNTFINPQDILKKSRSANLQAPALNPASHEIISKTRAKLNLSSNEEAMNALIAMGFEQIKAIFKL